MRQRRHRSPRNTDIDWSFLAPTDGRPLHIELHAPAWEATPCGDEVADIEVLRWPDSPSRSPRRVRSHWVPRAGSATWTDSVGPLGRTTSSEVRVSLCADPSAAADIAGRGALFSSRVRRLRIDRSSMFADGDEITWNARVRTFLVLWPRSTLRLTSSPSRNVTLITLLPRRRQLLSTGAFAKSGLAVATELRDRLARHLRASPISPAAVQVSSATPADTS